MQFLSVNIVIDLHKMLITQFGGLHGIRDKNLLESALAYPYMLHTMTEEKNLHVLAAAYGFHLIQNHPFVDGNKRIGTLVMMTFLRINHWHIDISNDKLYNLAIKIATSKINEEMIAKELKKHSPLNAL